VENDLQVRGSYESSPPCNESGVAYDAFWADVLRCIALYCGVLRCVAVYCGVCGVCGVLRCVAVYCGVLRCLAVCCSVEYRVAVGCRELQWIAVGRSGSQLQWAAVGWSGSHWVATSYMRHVAVVYISRS